MSALVFSMIGGIFAQSAFGRSGMGADWGGALAAVMIAVQACAGFLFGVGLSGCVTRVHWRFALVPLIGGLLLPVTLPLHAKVARATDERRWTEEQERQRREPHALVNDITLSENEDSGYRIRFVDDKGVVRDKNDFFTVPPYVVLPAGRRRLVIKADTPKGERLKLEWVLQETVDVQAGAFYKLKVQNGKVTLQKTERRRSFNRALEPTTLAHL